MVPPIFSIKKIQGGQQEEGHVIHNVQWEHHQSKWEYNVQIEAWTLWVWVIVLVHLVTLESYPLHNSKSKFWTCLCQLKSGYINFHHKSWVCAIYICKQPNTDKAYKAYKVILYISSSKLHNKLCVCSMYIASWVWICI